MSGLLSLLLVKSFINISNYNAPWCVTEHWWFYEAIYVSCGKPQWILCIPKHTLNYMNVVWLSLCLRDVVMSPYVPGLCEDSPCASLAPILSMRSLEFHLLICLANISSLSEKSSVENTTENQTYWENNPWTLEWIRLTPQKEIVKCLNNNILIIYNV